MRIALYISVILILSSCGEGQDIDPQSSSGTNQNKGSVLPVLETGIPMQVDGNLLQVRGQIKELGKKEILEYGHSWSLTNTTNSLQNVTTFGARSNTGTFQTEIEVQKGNTYFIQAYAISVVGTTFGEVQQIEIQ